MTSTTDIVGKLWGLCNVLRDDGVTCNEYVTELTYLLFLKMLEETGHENRLPNGWRWGILAKKEGMEQLDYYKAMLLDLGKAKDRLVAAIFIDAQTRLREPTNLKALTSNIDQLDWFSAREEGLGNLYEGLLEKNASDKKSGAGQYFTPRPLIDCIVRLMQPQPGEMVQDPAAGTAGFLVAADRFIKDHTDDLYGLPEAQAYFQRHDAFFGAELVPDTHRLCMMNLLLHGIEGGVENIDTLSPDGEGGVRDDPVHRPRPAAWPIKPAPARPHLGVARQPDHFPAPKLATARELDGATASSSLAACSTSARSTRRNSMLRWTGAATARRSSMATLAKAASGTLVLCDVSSLLPVVPRSCSRLGHDSPWT